jgi:LCP family protein required for cell wall assembly
VFGVGVLLAALCVLAADLAYIYVTNRLNQIPRIAVAGLQPAGAGDPQNILVTGSDSRADESAADAQHFGSASDVSGQRSDVIVLIHLDPRTAKAALLSIPRDTFVPIAGTRSSNRINAAFAAGPAVLVQTISQAFGIVVNHYVQEDFSGLQALADAVDGVCMSFPFPARDSSPTGKGSETGLDIPTPGPHVLHGAEALALVRSRYYQYLQNGAWHAEGTGDIGRIERQHDFMRALASKVIHSVLNPSTAGRVLNRAVKTVRVDDSMSTAEMLRLAVKVRSLRPADIPSFTLPYRAVNGYGSFGDVLLPEPAPDAQVIAAWANYGAPGTESPAPTPAPSSTAPPAGHARASTPPPAPPAVPSSEPRPPWDPVPC